MFLNKRLVISVHPLGHFQKRSIVLPLFTGLMGSKSVVELHARLAVLTSEGAGSVPVASLSASQAQSLPGAGAGRGSTMGRGTHRVFSLLSW